MIRANVDCRFVRRWLGQFAAGLATVLVAGLSAQLAVAQAPPAAGNQAAQKKIPAPDVIDLETKDGVQLQLTYYASAEGKDAVPVILLHGWKGSRADLDALAMQLQLRGDAVIVPDLRGHGKSTQYKQNGQTYTIDQNTMKKADFMHMSDYDLETVKSFIKDKNNLQELNMEKLCVVGYEMGAIVAARWTHKDWDWPHLLTGKQGEDVKALVLIAPSVNFNGLNMQGNDALGSPHLQNDDIQVMFLPGGQSPKLKDADRMYNKMLRPRAKFDSTNWQEKETVFEIPIKDTTLQTANLLSAQAVLKPIFDDIAWLIDARVAKKKTPWALRK